MMRLLHEFGLASSLAAMVVRLYVPEAPRFHCSSDIRDSDLTY
jgi:hypothetical protein